MTGCAMSHHSLCCRLLGSCLQIDNITQLNFVTLPILEASQLCKPSVRGRPRSTALPRSPEQRQILFSRMLKPCFVHSILVFTVHDRSCFQQVAKNAPASSASCAQNANVSIKLLNQVSREPCGISSEAKRSTMRWRADITDGCLMAISRAMASAGEAHRTGEPALGGNSPTSKSSWYRDCTNA